MFIIPIIFALFMYLKYLCTVKSMLNMTTMFMPKLIRPLMSNEQWDIFCYKYPNLRCVPSINLPIKLKLNEKRRN